MLSAYNFACFFSLIYFIINGLIKPFFRGSKLWIKLVCRSCEKVIQTFKLNCSCYLQQKEHSHLYGQEKCLSCALGDYVQPLSVWDLPKKYEEYCQDWQEWAEIRTQISRKKQYKYDGETYWAECSFCTQEIAGHKTHREPLQRNKVSFWTENLLDERIICGVCLREKRMVSSLGVKGIRRQMLYNYRQRGII